MHHEKASSVRFGLLRAGRSKHPCLVTETWAIALVLLGCPVILGLLLAVLSVLEDSLSESVAPAVTDSTAESATTAAAPTSRSDVGPIDRVPVAEGARL